MSWPLAIVYIFFCGGSCSETPITWFLWFGVTPSCDLLKQVLKRSICERAECVCWPGVAKNCVFSASAAPTQLFDWTRCQNESRSKGSKSVAEVAHFWALEMPNICFHNIKKSLRVVQTTANLEKRIRWGEIRSYSLSSLQFKIIFSVTSDTGQS